MKLDGKTALITGGASGIGRAIVLSFARHGARVICADINQEKAAEVAKEAKSGNYTIESVAVDLADPKSARRCAEEVISRYTRGGPSGERSRLGRRPELHGQWLGIYGSSDRH